MKRTYWAIGICVVLAIAIVVGIRMFSKPQVKVTYSYVSIGGFTPGQRIGNDLLLENSLTVDKPHDNDFLLSQQTNMINFCRTAAQKLGLGYEALKVNGDGYWLKDSKNASTNYIKFSASDGRIRLSYEYGINSDTVQPENAYKYLIDFFGIDAYNAVVANKQTRESTVTTSFKIKFNDADLYMDKTSESAGFVTMKNGKIIDAGFYILPKDLANGGKLKSIEKIDTEQIASTYYYSSTKPESLPAQLTVGGEEAVAVYPVKINLQSYKEVYYAYYSPTDARYYMVPAYFVSGNYLDSKDNPGTVSILMLNQQHVNDF